jgi:hypothetical protein
MKPPVLLCFNLPAEKAAKLRQLAMRLGVRVRIVDAEEHNETLSMLCGWEPSADIAPVEPFADEMLVLANFSGTQLNDFLGGLRRGQIPPVALKAVLTDTNMRWSAAKLHAELVEEHRALAAQEPSHRETSE